MILDRPAVSLEELTERASLQNRLDRKYLLPVTDLPLLLGSLSAEVRVLEIDGRRDFDYRSVYFDTPELDSYLTAARRRRRRFKIRIRSYVDSDLHVLEVKTRGPRGTTVKHRLPYAGVGGALGADDRARTAEVLVGAGIRSCPQGFVPTLTTRYRRTTLFVPATDSRVTIDTAVQWTRPGGAALRLADCAIVETKSARTRTEVDRLLWSLKHRPVSISKYATGLAALRPDLPAHRWTSVLRRHLSSVTDPDQENRS